MGKSYKELMPNIDTLIFDVDGVFTNGIVTVYPNGELLRQMNVKDGYAVKAAINAGFKICVISGGTNEGVKSRLERLGIKNIYLGIHDKIKPFSQFIKDNKINPKTTLYMGDDIPDYPVMEKVGFPCCPSDACPEIKKLSVYISPKKGGEGCVRDVLEQIMRVQNKWKDNFYAKYD